MAKKRSALDERREQLAGLVAERDGLLKRIPELEQEREAVSVDDAAQAVAQLTAISNELDASRRVLGSLEARISQLRAEVDEAQSEQDRAEVAKLWPQEQAAMQKVVKLVGDLVAECEELETIQRQIRDHRGMPMGKAFDLRPALVNMQKSWDVWGWWHAAAAGEPGGPRPSLPDPEPAGRWQRIKGARDKAARLMDASGFPMEWTPTD